MTIISLVRKNERMRFVLVAIRDDCRKTLLGRRSRRTAALIDNCLNLEEPKDEADSLKAALVFAHWLSESSPLGDAWKTLTPTQQNQINDKMAWTLERYLAGG